MLEHLHGIEENYQKYAFYYTKYLEERVAHSEEMKKIAKDLDESQEHLKEVIDILTATMEVLQTPQT